MPRTRDEIAQLKRSWEIYPCFDIEDTPGFEEHREELLAFRNFKEAMWAKQRAARREKLSALICPLRNENCVLERCALWDSDYERCTIALLGLVKSRESLHIVKSRESLHIWPPSNLGDIK